MYGEVEEILILSPSMIRIVLGGSGLDGFRPNESTDQYINAYFILKTFTCNEFLDLKRVFIYNCFNLNKDYIIYQTL